MATRSELAQYQSERHGPNPKRVRKLAQRKSYTEAHLHHEPIKAGKKASWSQDLLGGDKRIAASMIEAPAPET